MTEIRGIDGNGHYPADARWEQQDITNKDLEAAIRDLREHIDGTLRRFREAFDTDMRQVNDRLATITSALARIESEVTE